MNQSTWLHVKKSIDKSDVVGRYCFDVYSCLNYYCSVESSRQDVLYFPIGLLIVCSVRSFESKLTIIILTWTTQSLETVDSDIVPKRNERFFSYSFYLFFDFFFFSRLILPCLGRNSIKHFFLIGRCCRCSSTRCGRKTYARYLKNDLQVFPER